MALVYLIGQDVPVSFTVLNDAGVATNATTVTVTVTAPDATTQTPTATQTGGTGSYTATVPAVTQAGMWLVRVVATGTGFQWAYEDQFEVAAQGIEQVVDLASVKAHLNIPATNMNSDDELRGFIRAAGPLIRDITGPILPETHTEYFNGGVSTISLSWQPLISVTSVTEYYGLSTFTLTEQPLGAQMNAFAYTVDYTTGQLTRRTFGGQAAMFAIGEKNIKVVYLAGLTAGTVPWNVRLGCLELIRHLWQMTQQGGRPKWGGAGVDADAERVPIGFAVPDRVIELLAPNRRPPGIA